MNNVNVEIRRAAMIVLGIGVACIAASLVSGCNFQGDTGQQGSQGVPGDTGQQGPTGAQGLGSGVQVTAATTCPNGGFDVETFLDPFNTGLFQTGDTVTSLSTICNGIDGSNGATGAAGSNGSNGNSFQVSQAAATVGQCPAGGVVYTTSENDGNGNQVAGSVNQSVVCNGQNGATGATGAAGQAAPFSPITPIQPCGNASSPWKEVLLCLENGSVLGDFSETASGQDTRLSFLPAGSYIDTDESGCNFSVSVDNAGDTTVSWGAGSNQYATWVAGSTTCTAN